MEEEEEEEEKEEEEEEKEEESGEIVSALFVGIDSLISNLVEINFLCFQKLIVDFGYKDLTFSESLDFFESVDPALGLGFLLPYTSRRERVKVVEKKERMFCEFVRPREEDEVKVVNIFQVEKSDRKPVKLHVTDGIKRFLKGIESYNSNVSPKYSEKEKKKKIKKEGIKVFAVCDISQEECCQCLKNLGLHHLFDYVMSSGDLDERKPSKGVYDYIFGLKEKFPGLSKKNCIVLEGSERGVKAAKDAGIKTIIGLKHIKLSKKIQDQQEHLKNLNEKNRKEIDAYHDKRFKETPKSLIQAGAKMFLDDLNDIKVSYLNALL